MSQVTLIRFAAPRDLSDLIELCKAHALFEKSNYDEKGKALSLEKHLFNPSPTLFCLVIESEERVVGYCTYMKQFSTWDCDFYLYMDCLYLKEDFRNIGIGTRLMERIQEEAVKMGIQFLQWQTPNFNKDAIQFYNKIGAQSAEKERFVLRVDR